jgi:signal transduction histidine kinase
VSYNNTRVVQNGVYVGDPAWRERLAGIRRQPSGINRVELVIGGWGDASFTHIKNLIASQGTGTNSLLYRDLVALKEAAGIEAIQYADEQTYDVASAVEFGEMIGRAGLRVTLRPYTDQGFWTSVKSRLGSQVDAVYLQCYDAGAENNPRSWIEAFGGFKVYPGLGANSDTPSSVTAKMRQWQRTLGISGGFMWLNGFMPSDAAKWAGALACGLDPVATVRIVNKNSGKFMDLLNGSMTNGSVIAQQDYDPGNEQRWLVAPSEDGEHFKIVSWLSGQSASIATDSTMTGALLWSWDYNSDSSQQFDLMDAGNGWLKIRNVRSGLSLEIEGGSLANHAVVRQNLDMGAAHQLWRFYTYGDDVLAYENFDYPAGPLGGQDGGEGWSGTWENDLGSTAAVVRGTLADTTNGAAGFVARAARNWAYVGADQRVGRYLDCSSSGLFGAHGYVDGNGRIGARGTSLYMSFVQQPSRSSLFYEFELNRGAVRIAGIGNDTTTAEVNLRTPSGRFIPLGPGDTNENFYVMRIDFKGGNDDVRVYRNPSSAVATATLTMLNVGDMSFNRISLAAFANGNTVKHGQIRLATSWQEVLGDGPDFSLQAASNLVSDDLFRRVTLAAQVLHGEGQEYYLQTGTQAVRAQLSHAVHFEPGELVDVAGLVERVGPPIVLIEATGRGRGKLALPRPEPMPVPGAQYDSRWVSVVGTLAEIKSGETGVMLELQVGSKRLTAKLRTKEGDAAAWAIDSRLRLSGVLVGPGGSLVAGREEAGCELLLNSAADIEMVARPPWWTLRRLLIMVGVFGTGLALAFIWISLLRRQVEQRTMELNEEVEEHKRTEAELQAEIAERLRMEMQVEKTHKELMIASRQAGMAEVATSVLHNVGNALNSVNVSASLLTDHLKESKLGSLKKAVALLNEHTSNLAAFLTEDSKGKLLPGFLTKVVECLDFEQSSALNEFHELSKNIGHITEIVAMQQDYARTCGVVECVQITEVVEDALRMNSDALASHNVHLERQFASNLPEVSVDRHKVIQILNNLICNAIHACEEAARPDKNITAGVSVIGHRIQISVADNGVGIPSENVNRIFNYGFTTRKNGHGFGLHGSACAAMEMGGTLGARSEGVGKGAVFTLELPIQIPITR